MKVLSFLSDNSEVLKNKGSNEVFVVTNNEFDTTVRYDAVMYDAISLVSFEDNRDLISNHDVFKISLLSDISEIEIFKNFRTDGWILESKLSKLPEFLEKASKYL